MVSFFSTLDIALTSSAQNLSPLQHQIFAKKEQAVIVDYSTRCMDPTIPNYISTGQLQAIGVRDTDTFRTLANYDPFRESVVLILFGDGAQPFKLTAHPVAM